VHGSHLSSSADAFVDACTHGVLISNVRHRCNRNAQ
jgi:hypothetical protein